MLGLQKFCHKHGSIYSEGRRREKKKHHDLEV